ncbi:hypothetical protein [Rhizobium mongolense]|uniref:hypothetical protein n=1 Tax=Rhizobium mongolense TaxID=57676 RepID=UPI0034A2FB45
MTASEITIFFSWQSDLPQGPTTKAIRKALREAFSEIEADHDVHLKLDEATRNVPGAANIPFEIARKIEAADIFVCDITTVATVSGKQAKSLPNPNVTFELGLSVGHLGWYRTILMFNEQLAEMQNLPFDFDRQRISKYKMADSNEAIKAAQGDLRSLLRVAVEHIVLEAPKRPSELKNKSEAEIRRERDLVNIRWYLRQISTSLLDMHIREMPDRLHYFAGFMHDNLRAVVHRSDFELYDRKLQEAMLKLYKRLGKTLEYDRFYRELSNTWVQGFGMPRRNHFSAKDASDEQTAATEILAAVRKLDKSVRALVKKIRADYIEIDLDETNAICSTAYRKETGQDN